MRRREGSPYRIHADELVEPQPDVTAQVTLLQRGMVWGWTAMNACLLTGIVVGPSLDTSRGQLAVGLCVAGMIGWWWSLSRERERDRLQRRMREGSRKRPRRRGRPSWRR